MLRKAAWVMATAELAAVRNGSEAVAFAERAKQLAGGHDPVILDTLAAAYAEAGRFPEAIEAARGGLAEATRRMAQPLVEALKARIALYEAGCSATIRSPG